ncbi:MAG: PIG-L family deacetylase [Anaerolineales bacterium]|jgi:LmbE family N-acetylglucosaminyl deacetylase
MIQWDSKRTEIFIPDKTPPAEALSRTTYLGIGAHQDDLELMAVDGILRAYQKENVWFSGVVVTDGRGAPRSGTYKDIPDEELKMVRDEEQRKAAVLGEYSVVVFLNRSSTSVKNSANQVVVQELAQIVEQTQPKVVYTHNLMDKHPTHVAVCLRVLTALRTLPLNFQPQKVYGCEVWRGLDWLSKQDKVQFDTSQRGELQSALLKVFDSQISGGKRYDLAAMGRRRANATFDQSHAVDHVDGVALACDLTPLVTDANLDINKYVKSYVARMAGEISEMLDDLV